jgi:cysteine desulfurase
MDKIIYLDNAAGTRLYPEVIEVMTDVMTNHWGNASSNNSIGDDARILIENVRQQIADDINAEPEEIIFTSGACEANSLALNRDDRCIHTSTIEHSSIQDNPYTRSMYKVDNQGFVELDHIYIYEIVSIAAANGEIGTIQDIQRLSKKAHKKEGVIFHTDATQLFPERRIDVKELDVDMISVSAQKFHGPRGAGFLYVKNGTALYPIIHGSQENGFRGGTYNTAAIVGMGKALEITRSRNASNYVESLRNKFLDQLLQIPDTHLNGAPIGTHRLVNNISLTIDGVNASRLVTMCDLAGVIIAKGSACQSHVPKPSATLKAIGLSDEQALNTIRITLDEFNTEQEICYAADIITKLVERIRDEKKD